MKLRQRFLAFSFCIVFGFFILIVIETEMHIVNRLPDYDQVTGKQHKIRQRSILNREEASKMSGEANNQLQHVFVDSKTINPNTSSSTTTITTDMPKTTVKPRDNFSDLFKYTTFSANFRQYMMWPPKFVLPKNNPTLGDLLNVRIR